MFQLQADHRTGQDRRLLPGPDVVRASAEGDPGSEPHVLEDSRPSQDGSDDGQAAGLLVGP